MSSEQWLSRFDGLCERWTDRFNPVLVKEVRQALRSRGFTASFLLTLGGCWCLSLALVGMEGDALQQGDSGPEFFRAYLFALLIPLCFIVPMGLFGSVIAEFRDQTFEVLATSRLTPQQIVVGKLQGAGVSMAAYLSAMAPFLCFTYLLRGLDLPVIAIGLLVACLASLVVSLGALALGALVKNTLWQMPGVLLAVVWAAVVFGAANAIAGMLAESRWDWGLSDLLAGTACFGYFFLFYLLLTLGLAALIPLVPRADSGWWLVIPLVIAGSGLGLLVSQLNNYTLAPISEEKVSEAAGVNSAAGSFGLSFGLAFAGAIMLATLSITFTSKAEASSVLPPDDKQRVARALEDDAQVMSNTQLEEALAGQPENIQDEIIRINTEARPLALQVALLIPVLAGLVGLFNSFRMMRLPDPKPSSAAEGMAFG